MFVTDCMSLLALLKKKCVQNSGEAMINYKKDRVHMYLWKDFSKRKGGKKLINSTPAHSLMSYGNHFAEVCLNGSESKFIAQINDPQADAP